MSTLTMTELAAVGIALPCPPKCRHCQAWFGEAGNMTLDEVRRAAAQHKNVCPNWPSPRSRTAQHQPIKGQMTIPVSGVVTPR
jgi:hypothetical protein